ncbi:MAG: hypothetical protein U0M21_08775 [Emergencia sp.]|nr:hypothetical protein [Emergencia sp.]
MIRLEQKKLPKGGDTLRIRLEDGVGKARLKALIKTVREVLGAYRKMQTVQEL